MLQVKGLKNIKKAIEIYQRKYETVSRNVDTDICFLQVHQGSPINLLFDCHVSIINLPLPHLG